MIYNIKRFSATRDDRGSNTSIGERAGAAAKVVGLGSGAALGAGYGITKGASMYLGNKSAAQNFELLDSFINRGTKEGAERLKAAAGKKAAYGAGEFVTNHVAGKLGKSALIAGGIGLTGAMAQKYYKNKKRSEKQEELYSVLLDETEYALYSEFQKEFGLVQRTVGAVKNFVRPIAGNFNFGKLAQDVRTKIGGLVSSYRKSHAGGIVDNAFKAGEAGGGFSPFKTASELAKGVWNRYKVATPPVVG